MVDIASELRRNSFNLPVTFRIAGDMDLGNGGNDPLLHRIAARKGTIADYSGTRVVTNIVKCLGYVDNIKCDEFWHMFLETNQGE